VSNYLSKMLYALTSAYSRKDYDNHKQDFPLETNIGKLFSILAWGFDSIEEQAELIRMWDDIDHARGAVLDRYGANLGVKRVSPDDLFYRLAIKVKVMAQLSGGDSDTVIKAASALLDVEPSDVLLEDVYPAKIALFVDQTLIRPELLALVEPIAYAIKRILAAGVGMRVYLRTYRTYRHDLIFLRCGYSDTQLSSVPVGEDRESTNVWGVGFGGFDRVSFMPPPFSEDRLARQPVTLAQGAFHAPEVILTPPTPESAYRGRQDGAGGAIYHAHIKSKRID